MRKLKTFGFKFIEINGTSIYTCNISIDRNVLDNPDIDGVSFVNTTTLVGKYKREKEVVKISYFTTDYSQHERMRTQIQLFLEQYHIQKIKNKYSHLHIEPDTLDSYKQYEMDELNF